MNTGINLHLHTNDDDRDQISYSFIDALNKSKELGIRITAITCHDKFINYDKYKEEAANLGMLFIPGIEKTIEDAHVVILNCDKNIESVNSFNDLREYKKYHPDILVLAAHPFMPVSSLKRKLIDNIDIFDAIELTWFYTKLFNSNIKAEKIANKYNLPFIATSDAHVLENIGKGYAVIEINELTISSVFEAIKNKRFKNITKPQGFFKIFWYTIMTILNIR